MNDEVSEATNYRFHQTGFPINSAVSDSFAKEIMEAAGINTLQCNAMIKKFFI